MAVLSKEVDNKLILEIDNGDSEKLSIALEKWNIKDIQSYWRFCLSVLIETENNGLWIESNGVPVRIMPAKHSLKDGQEDGK